MRKLTPEQIERREYIRAIREQDKRLNEVKPEVKVSKTSKNARLREILDFEYGLNAKSTEFPASIAVLEAICDRFTDDELKAKFLGQLSMFDSVEEKVFAEFPSIRVETKILNFYGDPKVHFIPRSEEQALRQRAKEIVAELY